VTDNTAMPLPLRTDVAIVGSGYSGLCVAIRMKLAGLQDFVMLEQAATLGGTWRDNHYPGAACDIASNLYSFSFEPNPNWTRVYPQQPELKAYIEHCAAKYELGPHLHCDAAVTEARYDEAARAWRITVNGDTVVTARVLVSATGGLSRPAFPPLPGLEDFAGPVFHSARWRDDVALEGKRIAVVGTGASAIQFVPEIADRAARLTLFQRTAPWIIPKPDRALTAPERRRLRRHPAWQRLLRAADYTVRESRALFFTRWPQLLERAQRRVLRSMHRQVADASLRRQLTPHYVLGCKRILLSNDFYRTVQKPQVQVVTAKIDHVRVDGIATADGEFHPADVLILATGFETGRITTPFPVFGLGAIALEQAWAAGPQAYLGTTVAGYPNLFLMTGPNTGLGHNSMIYIIESQTRYVLDALQTMQRRGLGAVDVDAEVQARYNAEIQTRMRRTVWSTGGCKSWYLSPDGRNTTLWPDFTFRFRRRTRRFDLERYRTWPASASTG
jgi:cation diffusion facilitator CzcD-associated flavoprotein CzcO